MSTKGIPVTPLERLFRKYPLQVGKHYRHDGKLRRNQKKTCPWLGEEVEVIRQLKSGLYQVRVINCRFSWFDPETTYTLPKNEFLPIPGTAYDYPEDVSMGLTLKQVTENSDLIYIATSEGIGALMPRNTQLQRVLMLLTEPGNEVFDNYFNSTWFPMARGGSVEGNMAVVADKVATLNEDRLEDFVKVIVSHWQAIEDNFKWPLEVDFDAAVKREGELEQTVDRLQ
jgi:hypothetical protein